ncbi:MAG: mechanosensitive ion channel family protein [Acidimicrobiales bacterium]
MTKPRLGIAIAAAVGAVVAMVIGFKYGTYLHHGSRTGTSEKLAAYGAAAVFVVLGCYSTRRLANQLGRVVAIADKASASVVRLIITVAGLIVVVLITLGMLHIGASQLLLGGAITGVVIGIAAQQSLGNMFAGIVLLVAHPFRAGDHVRVRTGSLGGPFEGYVVSMGLTYVVFSTNEGTTYVPNVTLLASGIVRDPLPLPASAPATAPPVATAVTDQEPLPEGAPPTGKSDTGEPAPAGQPARHRRLLRPS